MANKTTYVLEIDAEISSLENKLKSMKGLMAGVLGSAQAPKGLEKSFEKIEGLLDKIRTKAAQPLDSNAGFASIKKDITGAGAALNNVVKIIESIGSLSEDVRISFLSPETQKEVQAIVDGLADFAEAIAASTIETKALTEAREKLAKAEASVAAVQQKLTTLNADLDTARQEKKTTEQAIAGIEKRKKELAELKKQQEEIEKFYNTPNEDGSKRNRSQKYAGVAMRPQDIKKKITNFETSMVGDEEALGRLREELKKTNGSIDSYLGKIGTAERDLIGAKRAQEELSTAVTEAQQAFDSGVIEKQQQAFSALREKAKALGISLEDIGENYSPDDASKLTAKFIELKNRGLDQVTAATTGFNQAAKETGEVVSGLTKKVDESAESFGNMAEAAREQEAFENKIKQFLGMAGAAQVLRSALRSAMDTIKELDATMTEMSVVTDLSVGDYWDQLPEYTKRANELGLAINDVYKADTLFYQQGLKTNEVVELSTETMKMAKIAGLDTAEATDRMTAALRGFNMELDKANAQKISDVYSELAAITAADVEEISAAMTKTASIASSAGMEFETTAAFLSQIIETTRESAETAGTAMKTVIARFQELKKAPDEIGEIDGEIVDANAIEKALRSVGVSLRDASGQFRELDDVFLELSSKWDSLDKNTQRYIATIAAGSRQQSRFIAMMSDYGRTQELVAAANNSAGASARQYEKTIDSLDTKLNKLKNAWDEFAMGILESDLVKTGVEILTKFLEVINKATSAFDGLGGSIAKIAAILMVFKLGSKIFEKLKQPLIDVFKWAVSMASPKGEEAGKKYGEGFVRGFKKVVEATEKTDKEQSKESLGTEEYKNGIGATIARTTGWADFNEGRQKRKRSYELSARYTKAEAAIKDRQAATAEANKAAKEFGRNSEEYTKAYQKVIKADQKCRENVSLTQEELDELTTLGKEGTDQMAKGFTKMGETAIAAGVGVSMLGGVLSTLGFDQLGESISWIGNGLTMVGTGISAIGALIPVVAAIAEKAGITVQAAWWWVAAIGAAVVALVMAVMGVAKAVENASPEKRLEKAQESAEAAADAADKLTESYNNLKDSLEEINNQNTNLENLVYGTKQWKEAVEDLNNEVLQLIQEYPQLAKFVENVDGVMSIDVNSAEVQAVLEEAKATANSAQVVATGAQLNILQMKDKVSYKNLDKKAKIDYRDPELEAGLAYTGATAGGAITGGGLGAIGFVGGPQIGAITTVAGAAVGAITAMVTGASDAAAEAARESAEASNMKSQYKTEQLAKALASGELQDTGSGYQLVNGMSKEEFERKYSELEVDQLDRFYAQIGDSTEALIDFGKSLLETEEQSRAYYDTMAAQSFQALNKTNWDANTRAIASNVLDGAAFEGMAENIENEIGDVDLTDKNLSADLVERRAAAIQKAYGVGAEYKDGNIVDAQGKVLFQNVDSDDLKNIIATAEAKTKFEDIGNSMQNVTTAIVESLSSQITDTQGMNSKEVEDAIIALMTSESGEELTQQQYDLLKNLGDEELEAAYEGNTLLQDTFGSIVNFKDKINKPILNTEKALRNADSFFTGKGRNLNTSKLTTGAKIALSDEEHLGSLYARGTAEEIAAFEEAFNNVMNNQENAAEIATYMGNEVDWSSEEALIEMQYELVDVYGVSEERAKALADAIIKANDATTGLAVNAFGDYYQACQKVEIATKKLTDLQWEYERALNGGADAIKLAGNLEEQRATALAKGQAALAAYNAKLAELDSEYAKGININGKDLTKYVKFDETTKTYDTSRLEEITANDTALAAAATEWVDGLNKLLSEADEQLDISKEAAEDLEELNQNSKDAFLTIYGQVEEMLISELEEQISIEQDLLNATEKANNQIISKLQEQIDETRRREENREKEEDLKQLRSKLGYLSSDTSGANQREIIELEKTIAEKEQEYLDTRIDQSIQSLQDANNKAAEQRERQISIAEQQLEIYKTSTAFQQDVSLLVTDFFNEFIAAQAAGITFNPRDTVLGQRLETTFTEGLNEFSRNDFWQTLSENVSAGAQWYMDSYLGNVGQKDNPLNKLLTEITKNTEAAAGLQMKQEYAVAVGKTEAIKNAWGVDLNRNSSIDKNDTGVDTAGSKTQDFISDVTGAYAGLNTSGTQAQEKHATADSLYKLMTSEAYKSYAPRTLQSEKEFYDDMSDEDFAKVQDAMASGNTEYYGLWFNRISAKYKEFQSNWEAKLNSRFAKLATNYRQDGFEGMVEQKNNNDLGKIIAEYAEIFGVDQNQAKTAIIEEKLKSYLRANFNEGSIDGDGDEALFIKSYSKSKEAWEAGRGSAESGVTLDGQTYDVTWHLYEGQPRNYIGWLSNPEDGWVAFKDGTVHAYNQRKDRWYRVNLFEGDGLDYVNAYRKKLQEGGPHFKYKTGGLADFTGPAWLDGTPSKPEYVLNSAQTERFFSLIDVLEKYDTDDSKKSSGDNYFDIEINVEKLENDYDVEKIANKIRSMIYNDATYRNVNAINHIR